MYYPINLSFNSNRSKPSFISISWYVTVPRWKRKLISYLRWPQYLFMTEYFLHTASMFWDYHYDNDHSLKYSCRIPLHCMGFRAFYAHIGNTAISIDRDSYQTDTNANGCRCSKPIPYCHQGSIHKMINANICLLVVCNYSIYTVYTAYIIYKYIYSIYIYFIYTYIHTLYIYIYLMYVCIYIYVYLMYVCIYIYIYI